VTSSIEINARLTDLEALIGKAKTDLTASTAAGVPKPYMEKKAKLELLEAERVALRSEHPHAVQRELDAAEIAADAAAKQARQALLKRRAEVAAQLVELFDPLIGDRHFTPGKTHYEAIVASERSCDALYTALRIAENAATNAAQKAFQHHDSEIGRGMIRRPKVC
jgi:hypothetical protein